MLDQSFSASNFRRILDLENRKGVHLEDKLSMTKIRKINEDIRDCNIEISSKKKSGNIKAVNELYETKKELRAQKEIELEIELSTISQNVARNDFKIELERVDVPDGRPIYKVPCTPEHFFALKQLQRNISRLFKVKQANRHAIVEQVVSLLGDGFPKFVVRTDAKEFYENIKHPPLLQRVVKDNLLTPFSKNIIKSLLYSYKNESGSNKGVPRGVGASAYLAELYMRDVDRDIRDLKGVTYYARYVDDILIIFTPSPSDGVRDYLKEVKDVIDVKHGVKLNADKTTSFDAVERGRTYTFQYLGYEIKFGAGKVKTKLTTRKNEKYRNRIKVAFDDYVNYSKVNEKEARRVLVKRVRFLTGNTRLASNKKSILVGIYYSNRYLTDMGQLSGLDLYLSWQISHKITSRHLKDRLSRYGFKAGFEQQRFSPFTTDDLSKIMKVWKKAY